MNMDLDAATKESPTLTLDPFAEAKAEIVEKKPEELVEEQAVPEMELTPEEQKQVDDFAAQIDLTNTQAVLQYGAGSQKKIADFSETALSNVRTKDMGEVGTLLTDVVAQLKDFDTEEDKGFFGLFKKSGDKLSNLKAKYDKAEVNITKICDAMESHQVVLLKDVAVLDKLYQLNLNYFKELSMYILAGKKKLAQAKSVELPELLEKAQKSGLPEDTQAAKDFAAMCERFEKKIADFSETALSNVRTKDMGEVGNLLTDVVAQLKDFDTEEDKGFFGLFKKSGDKLSNLKAKYDKAEVNITKICDAMESHQVVLLKDVAVLDKLYQLNLNYFKELSMYILAGKKKLAQAKSVELPELLEKAQKSGLPEDTQAAKDFAAMCERFEKKIYDLELTRAISLQMAPQIRLIQSNDIAMSEKIQSTLVNTIPLWKSQMVIAIGLDHATDAAKAQRAVSDMTNELLKKNAEALKVASVETAKESERGIVDIETLKSTNQTLMTTLDEVMKIQEEGRARRQSAEEDLQRIENEMRDKLLEMSRASHT